ncbi:MAG: hypothetical protein KAR45_04050, partial [Desulfobacteraceae bacterium]|nr:hypothetical protein [Desulfobacteraceae bacterium]
RILMGCFLKDYAHEWNRDVFIAFSGMHTRGGYIKFRLYYGQLMRCLVVFSGAFGCYFFCFFLKKCSSGGRKDNQIPHGLNQCQKINNMLP